MVFAISDLHLCGRGDKPMDIFGGNWEGYLTAIKKSWLDSVNENDIVLIAGDISWAMNLSDAMDDLRNSIAELPGAKVIIRGNHDYWWNSYNKLMQSLPKGFSALQNNAIRFGNILVAGTRGWDIATEQSSDEDKKIYARELIRLELALEDMKQKRKDGDTVIGMIHYPPFNLRREASGFTELFSRYGVDKVVYGHLHGKAAFVCPKTVIDGVEYILTSCDLVNNKLIKIV